MSAVKDLVMDVVEYYEQQDLAPDEIALFLHLPVSMVEYILKQYSKTYKQ